MHEMQYVVCTDPGWGGSFVGFEFRAFARLHRAPLSFVWQGTHKVGPKDIVLCMTTDLVLFSADVRRAVESELMGFEFHPAVVWWEHQRLDYWVLRCRHRFKSQCYRIAESYDGEYFRFGNLVVVGLDATKSDVWIGPGYKRDPYYVEMFVSQRFVDLCKRNKWKHASFTPLEDTGINGEPKDFKGACAKVPRFAVRKRESPRYRLVVLSERERDMSTWPTEARRKSDT